MTRVCPLQLKNNGLEFAAIRLTQVNPYRHIVTKITDLTRCYACDKRRPHWSSRLRQRADYNPANCRTTDVELSI